MEMDKIKLNMPDADFYQKIKDIIGKDNSSVSFGVNFSTPDKSLSYLDDGKPLADLFEQRHNQRNILFKFVIRATRNILVVYFILIILQSIVRLLCPQWSFISEKSFVYLTSAIFVYFLGVVIVITKSLWNETVYKPLHNKMLNIREKNKK